MSSHPKQAPGGERRGQACTAPPGPHTSRQHVVASGVSTFYFQTINRCAEKMGCPGDQAPASPCPLPHCSADHTQSPYKPAKPLKSPSWQPEPGKHVKSALPSPAGTAAQLRSRSGRRRLACCSPCLTDSLTQPHHGTRAIPGPAWMLLAPCSQLRGGASRVPELPSRVRLGRGLLPRCSWLVAATPGPGSTPPHPCHLPPAGCPAAAAPGRGWSLAPSRVLGHHLWSAGP